MVYKRPGYEVWTRGGALPVKKLCWLPPGSYVGGWSSISVYLSHTDLTKFDPVALLKSVNITDKVLIIVMLILHQNKAIDVNVVRHFTTGSPFYGPNHGIVEHNPFTKQETYWLILFLGKKRTHNVFIARTRINTILYFSPVYRRLQIGLKFSAVSINSRPFRMNNRISPLKSPVEHRWKWCCQWVFENIVTNDGQIIWLNNERWLMMKDENFTSSLCFTRTAKFRPSVLPWNYMSYN